MTELPNCPKCNSAYTYADGTLFVCPECAHEWSQTAEGAASSGAEAGGDSDADAGGGIRDANGNPLADGDTVIVIKDLKVKGTSSVVKVGTKVKSIRLVGGDHDIDCKVPGIGPMKLKSQFVKKV